jgi:hypothetical protein
MLGFAQGIKGRLCAYIGACLLATTFIPSVALACEGGEEIAEEGGGPFFFSPRSPLTFTARERKTVAVKNGSNRNITVTESELNVRTFFEIERDGCRAFLLEASGRNQCNVTVNIPGAFRAGETATMTILSGSGNSTYTVRS